MTTGYQLFAEGSVLIDWGNTRVLCAASVEERVPPFREASGGGWVTGEYSMLPRSTLTRKPRRTGGRESEIQRLIGRALRAAVDLDALGPRTITIDCDVLQADGGTRVASMTGGFVALALALRRLRAEGKLAADPLRQPVAAVSVGLCGGQALLDLDYSEDSRRRGRHEPGDDRDGPLRRAAGHRRGPKLRSGRARGHAGARLEGHRRALRAAAAHPRRPAP